MDKTTKAIIGLGSLAAISYLALAPEDKQEPEVNEWKLNG